MPRDQYHYLSVLVSLTHQPVIFFFKSNYHYFTSTRPCNRFLPSFKRFKRAQNDAFFIDWLMEIYSHVVMAVTGRRKRRNRGWSLILSKRCCLCPCSNLLWISRSRQHLIVMITMIRTWLDRRKSLLYNL